MDEHTPGPWEIQGDGKHGTGFGVWTGRNHWSDDMRPETVLLADARLIAAAPDMLAALEWALEKMDRGDGVLEYTGTASEGDLARAAVAKARGRAAESRNADSPARDGA